MTEAQAVISGAAADQYAAPLFIAWQLNSQCNLNCLHCCEEAGSEFPDQMTRQQMLNLCQQCVEAAVPYVALSGGEPLMCPHFWDVCEFLRANQVSVKVETNGVAGYKNYLSIYINIASCVLLRFSGGSFN